MKTLALAGFMVQLLIVGSASAAETLGDAQMDQITAGALPSCGGASMCSVNLASSETMTNTVTNSDGVIMTTTTGTGSCTAVACTMQGAGTMPTNSGSTTTTGNGVISTGSSTGMGSGTGTGSGTGGGAGTGTEPNTVIAGPSLSSFVSLQNTNGTVPSSIR
jgi:hypothetical protein